MHGLDPEMTSTQQSQFETTSTQQSNNLNTEIVLFLIYMQEICIKKSILLKFLDTGPGGQAIVQIYLLILIFLTKGFWL